MRFVQLIQRQPTIPSTHITLHEMQNAARLIVKFVQKEYFPDEVLALKSNKKIKSSSRLANLCPVLNNDVLCVGGRLRHAPITSEASHPMIVPNQHHIAEIIISYYHHALGHVGREHVLSTVRQHYWILNARVLTRRILRECVSCRRRNEAPMTQMMGELPAARVTPYEPPFTFTGLDIFGPFHVKRGRGSQKIYIFVCFVTRAVHIEDVGSIETDSFIQALRRFISLHGAAKEI